MCRYSVSSITNANSAHGVKRTSSHQVSLLPTSLVKIKRTGAMIYEKIKWKQIRIKVQDVLFEQSSNSSYRINNTTWLWPGSRRWHCEQTRQTDALSNMDGNSHVPSTTRLLAINAFCSYAWCHYKEWLFDSFLPRSRLTATLWPWLKRQERLHVNASTPPSLKSHSFCLIQLFTSALVFLTTSASHQL